MHGEHRQRIVTGLVDQGADLRQRLRLRPRRCRPHQDEACRHNQCLARAFELQHVRAQRGHHGDSRPRRVTVGHRPAEKDTSRDESDTEQHGERP
ncbi:Uncharacterised protein [Mycobacteroides abscessus subsp. massiliense]|nr:Uncharacterised protein [Mycobacteroides abscessus subsp. massiliense]